jgi:hypothetical protein
MLRKADLIRHLNQRLNPTLQDAMRRTEALKRKSPQPIIPIDPRINWYGVGVELGRGAFREWISCDHQGKRERYSKSGRTFCLWCERKDPMVCIWSAQCSPSEKTSKADEWRIVQKVFGILVVNKKFRSRTD